jgi:hypothetical protein
MYVFVCSSVLFENCKYLDNIDKSTLNFDWFPYLKSKEFISIVRVPIPVTEVAVFLERLIESIENGARISIIVLTDTQDEDEIMKYTSKMNETIYLTISGKTHTDDYYKLKYMFEYNRFISSIEIFLI